MSRRVVVVLAIFLAVLCGGAAFVWLHAGGQGKTTVSFTPDPPPGSDRSQPAAATQPTAPAVSTAGKQPEAAAAAPPVAPAGFTPPVGEALEFSANVSKVNNVATLRLSVNGRKEIAGKDAWHLQASAHTQNPLRIVFELDDQFDSYSAPGDFISVQYEMRLSERGTKVNSIQRMTSTGREPAPADATSARVLPG